MWHYLRSMKWMGWFILPAFFILISSQASISQAFPIKSVEKMGGLNLNLEQFATGLSSPVGLVNAGDDRLFAIEQAGRIRVIESDGTVLSTAFLNITGRVLSGGEMGLLGIAFHPDYANNGYFYLQYTSDEGGRHTRISRFSVSSNPNIADMSSENILLTINQPFINHNAGGIYFSPNDSYLYIPMGDGGAGNDPDNLAQTPSTLLGKIVRIDVDENAGTSPDCLGGFPNETGDYTIPPDNPFNTAGNGTCDEIWAFGLRNPYRGSFDRQTGDLWLGDVGQNAWEEIDFQPANSTGGENYGWRCYEGDISTPGVPACDPPNLVFPVHTMPNGPNCSVIGGYVYRGSDYPAMVGHYFASDFCTGTVWDITPNGNEWNIQEYTNFITFNPSAFGEDVNGELYVVDRGGSVHRLKAETAVGVILANGGQSQVVEADSTVTFVHMLTNQGNATDTFALSATSAQGWQVSVSDDPTVGAMGTRMVMVMVEVPAFTPPDTTDTITLTATSTNDPNETAQVSNTIMVVDTLFKNYFPLIAGQ